MELMENWTIKLNDNENLLYLSTVFVVSDNILYLFSSSPWSATPAKDMPSVLSELLIFEPFIVLRLNNGLFQEFTENEWQELLNSKETISASINTMPENCFSDDYIPDEIQEESDSSQDQQVDSKDDSDENIDNCTDGSDASVSDGEEQLIAQDFD